uniref:Coiled-coil domain-containing protein 172 n=1 Tax=Crassostrea virginica TaxID=6565 RepID=A0A8B8EZL9_CRAVI|nr:vicilin-like seed storage protein At2g18540 [Crassostrea virginica]
MTTSLDDLFNQIIHSELHAQQKKKYLQDLRCRVQATLSRTEELRKKHAKLKEELIFKTNVLIGEEVNLNSEEKKEQILQEKTSALEAEKRHVGNRMAELQSQRERAREEFCRSMREFIQDYGIQSDGHLRRKEEQRKTMEEVRRNEGTLKTELEIIFERNKVVEDLRKQLANEQQKVHSLQRTKEELNLELRNLREQTDILNGKKSDLNQVPYRDPEFLSLNKELETLGDQSLENECSALQQELQRLQQIWWQRQIKERQQALVSAKPQIPPKEKIPQKDKVTTSTEEPKANKKTMSNF